MAYKVLQSYAVEALFALVLIKKISFIKMKNFEDLLQKELEKLPYIKHLDDGQYNDGRIEGFELGARWAKSKLLVSGSLQFSKCKCGQKLKK